MQCFRLLLCATQRVITAVCRRLVDASVKFSERLSGCAVRVTPSRVEYVDVTIPMAVAWSIAVCDKLVHVLPV